MNTRINTIFFFLFSVSMGWSQSLIVELDEKLAESSALIVINDSSFITLNDSGNTPELYVFNIEGEVTHTCYIANSKNKDWEALAYDGENRLFIGDIGDNKNKRKKRTIYTVFLDEVLTEDTTIASVMSFTYQEQTAFPPPKEALYYDAEALVFKNDSLFVFTKNRTVPFDGIVKVYALNLIDSIQEAAVFFELELPATSWIEDSVTDAFYDDGTLLLLTYSKIYHFNWENNKPKYLDKKLMENVTQKEGVFLYNGTIFLTDEASPFGTQSLYSMPFWK